MPGILAETELYGDFVKRIKKCVLGVLKKRLVFLYYTIIDFNDVDIRFYLLK